MTSSSFLFGASSTGEAEENTPRLHTSLPMCSEVREDGRRSGTILQWDSIERRGTLQDDLTGESRIIANPQAFESVLPTHLRGDLQGVKVFYVPADHPQQSHRVLIRRRVDSISAKSYREKPPVDFISLGAQDMGKVMSTIVSTTPYGESRGEEQHETEVVLKREPPRASSSSSSSSPQKQEETPFSSVGDVTAVRGETAEKKIPKSKAREENASSSPVSSPFAQHIVVDVASLTPEQLAHCDGPLALHAFSKVALAANAFPSLSATSPFAIAPRDGYPSSTPTMAKPPDPPPHETGSSPRLRDRLQDGGVASHRTLLDHPSAGASSSLPSLALERATVPSAPRSEGAPESAVGATSSVSPPLFSMLLEKEVAVAPPKHLKDMRSSVLFDRRTNEWIRLRRALGSTEKAEAYLEEKRLLRDKAGKGGSEGGEERQWRTVVKARCVGVVLAWSSLHRTGVIEEGCFSAEVRRRMAAGHDVEKKKEGGGAPEAKKENKAEEGRKNASQAPTGVPSPTSSSPTVALIRSVHCFETALPSSLSLRGRRVVFDMVQYASHPQRRFAEGIEVLEEELEEETAAPIEHQEEVGDRREANALRNGRGQIVAPDGGVCLAGRQRTTPLSPSSLEWKRKKEMHLDVSLPRLSFSLPFLSPDGDDSRADGIHRDGQQADAPKNVLDSDPTRDDVHHRSNRPIVCDRHSAAASSSHVRSRMEAHPTVRLYGVITRWSGHQGIIESSNGKYYAIPSAACFNQLVDTSSHTLRGAVVSFRTSHPVSSSSASVSSDGSSFSTPRSSMTPSSATMLSNVADGIDLLCVAGDNLKQTRPMMELSPRTSRLGQASRTTSAPFASDSSASLASRDSSEPNGSEMEEKTTPSQDTKEECEEGEGGWKFGFLVAWSSVERQGIIQGEDSEKGRYVLKDITENIKGKMICSTAAKNTQAESSPEGDFHTTIQDDSAAAEKKGALSPTLEPALQVHHPSSAATTVFSPSSSSSSAQDTEKKKKSTTIPHRRPNETNVSLSSSAPCWSFSRCHPSTKAFQTLVKQHLTLGRRLKFMTYGTTGLLACNVVVLPEMVRDNELAASQMEFCVEEAALTDDFTEETEEDEEAEWKDDADNGADPDQKRRKKIMKKKKSPGMNESSNGEEEAIVSPTCTSYWLQRMERAGYDVKEVSTLQNKALVPPSDDDDNDGEGGSGNQFLDSEDLFKKDHWWTDPRKNKKFPNSNVTAGHLALIGPASMMNLAAKASDPKRLDKMVRRYQARLTEDQKALAWEKAREMAPKYEACIRRAKSKSEEPSFHFF